MSTLNIGNLRHGQSGTRAYYAWTNMKTRCLNPKNEKFKDYGGRGIEVCAPWLKFAGFFADMGVCPAGLTLERKDVNGNYDANNCIWTTPDAQAKNRRTRIAVNGVLMTKREASAALGLAPHTIATRLQRGWPLERAIAASKGGQL